MYCTLLLVILALSIITTTSLLTEEEEPLKAKVVQVMLVAWMVAGLKEFRINLSHYYSHPQAFPSFNVYIALSPNSLDYTQCRETERLGMKLNM